MIEAYPAPQSFQCNREYRKYAARQCYKQTETKPVTPFPGLYPAILKTERGGKREKKKKTSLVWCIKRLPRHLRQLPTSPSE
jgi:hypothetical protein